MYGDYVTGYISLILSVVSPLYAVVICRRQTFHFALQHTGDPGILTHNTSVFSQ